MNQSIVNAMRAIRNRNKYDVLESDLLDNLLDTVASANEEEQKLLLGTIAAEYVRMSKELEEQVEYVKEISETDPLTKVTNRLKTQTILETEWERSKRYHSPTSVIMLDLDNLMPINDEYGQEIGDQILKELASVIRKSIRLTDTLGRWGGDEFLVIVPTTNNIQASWLGNKLRKAIAQHTFINDIQVTCSFGVADSEASMDPKDWVKIVNEALQYAKSNGKNQVIDYEDINNH